MWRHRIHMSLPSLPSGNYMVVLCGGQYIANAVFGGRTFGEGFTNLTAGNLCKLSINGADCPNTSGAYALDIATPRPSSMSEPSSFPVTLLGPGLLPKRPDLCFALRDQASIRNMLEVETEAS